MSQIENHPNWIARDLGEDFGIDAEAELSEPSISGAILKLQFKTSQHVRRQNGTVCFEIDPKYIAYANACRYPVIMVRIDLATNQAWYLWLQQWLLSMRAQGTPVLNSTSRFIVWVDDRSTLATGLANNLQAIAQWRGETQLVLSLLDALHAATATYNGGVMDRLIDLMAAAVPTVADASVDVVVREAIILGDRLRGTMQGLAISERLFSLVRQYGNRLSACSVEIIVRRGESYSRTGLVALGILYDDHFAHASSLDLPRLFQQCDLPGVAYYCALREQNHHKKDLNFLSGPGNFVFAGLRFKCPDGFPNTFANRGASAILDYLVPIDMDGHS